MQIGPLSPVEAQHQSLYCMTELRAMSLLCYVFEASAVF